MTNGTHSSVERPVSRTVEALVRFGPAVIVAMFYVAVIWHYAYTPDETYKYLQSAKYVANGGQGTLDANAPVDGIAAPLWVLLIAGGVKAGLDPFIVAKTFDILFASLSLVLVYSFSATLMQDRLFALVAVLIFSFDAFFLKWSGTGMETSFTVILVLLTVKYSYAGDYHIGGFVAGLATLAIPEAVFLFVIVLIDGKIHSFILGRSNRMLWAAGAAYAAVVVPWLIFSYASFGSILPGREIGESSAHWSFTAAIVALLNVMLKFGSTQLLAVFILLVGIPLIVLRRGPGSFLAQALPLLWVPVVLVGYGAIHMQVSSRFLVPLIPLILVYAVWSLKQIETWLQWAQWKGIIVLCIFAALTIVQNQIIYAVRLLPAMNKFSESEELGIKPIALWLRSYSSLDASVLTPEAGMLGYIAERQTVSMTGWLASSGGKTSDVKSYCNTLKKLLRGENSRPNFVVDRASSKERLVSDSFKPIMMTRFTDRDQSRSDTICYTLYEVIQ